jgi:Ca2+-binding RTX toxin-like protein
MLPRLLTVAAVAVASLSIAAPARAAAIDVGTLTDENGSGVACSLREAVRSANTDSAFGGCTAGNGDDVINVPAGTYQLTVMGTGEEAATSGDLDITDNVTVSGGGARTTIVDGGDIDRVFHVAPAGEDVSAILQNLSIRNGTAPGTDCGGGIANAASLTISRVAILDNAADCGGGIVNRPDPSPTVPADLTIQQSLIAENRATGADGGGVVHQASMSQDATLLIENSTLSTNTAFGDGGGLSSGVIAGATLENATVADNTADVDSDGTGDGGGVATGTSTVTTSNTIIGDNNDGSTGADPEQPDCAGPITSGGYNLIEDTSGCAVTTTTGDVTGQDPRLQQLADNGGPTDTRALRNNSPAVDAGNPANETGTGGACEPEDQRGFDRPRGPTCDIGAFERGAGEQLKCFNKRATFVGTNGPDVIGGTSKRDVIVALGGDDVITTGGRNDLICAGAGNDNVRGQAGDDQVLGESGNDRIRGGGGSDTLVGNAGRDKLKGQGASDTLKGGGGKDRLNGGGSTDRCVGGPGKDKLRRCE